MTRYDDDDNYSRTKWNPDKDKYKDEHYVKKGNRSIEERGENVTKLKCPNCDSVELGLLYRGEEYDINIKYNILTIQCQNCLEIFIHKENIC